MGTSLSTGLQRTADSTTNSSAGPDQQQLLEGAPHTSESQPHTSYQDLVSISSFLLHSFLFPPAPNHLMSSYILLACCQSFIHNIVMLPLSSSAALALQKVTSYILRTREEVPSLLFLTWWGLGFNLMMYL
jgi:hypothetical protein